MPVHASSPQAGPSDSPANPKLRDIQPLINNNNNNIPLSPSKGFFYFSTFVNLRHTLYKLGPDKGSGSLSLSVISVIFMFITVQLITLCNVVCINPHVQCGRAFSNE